MGGVVGRGRFRNNHLRKTGRKMPEKNVNVASTLPVPSLAPKFSVQKNETTCPAFMSGFSVVPETMRTLDPGHGMA